MKKTKHTVMCVALHDTLLQLLIATIWIRVLIRRVAVGTVAEIRFWIWIWILVLT